MKQWLVVVVPVFLCLLWGCPALPFPPPQARAATVEGYVVKAATGEPLEGASVNLRPARGGKADYSAVTRPDGHFLLTQIEPGQYRLWAQADGFLPVT